MFKNNSSYTKGSTTFQDSLNKKIRSLSDRELIAMVNSPTADYLPEALSIANDEIEIRGGMNVLKPQVQELIEKEIKKEKKEKIRIEEEKISDAKTSSIFWIILLLVILIISFLGDWGENKIIKFLSIPLLLIVFNLYRMYFYRISFNRKKNDEHKKM